MSVDLRINHTRLLADLTELAGIGAHPDGGVNRPALSEADREAWRWFRTKAEAAGFQVQQDGMGNISAVLASAKPGAQTIMLGSHMDSVPSGGRFDGALGVVAALEVLRTVKEAGLNLDCHLEAMSFTDEEGRWGPLLGSRALAGRLSDNDFERPRGGREAFAAAMAGAGLTQAGALAALRDPASLRAWIEVHVEQGTRLEEAGFQVGSVSGIVGISSYWLTFVGRADHAGTTPLERRADALRGVAEFIRQARELVTNRFKRGVYNCGIVEISPGAFNIVPERARVALEFRHVEEQRLEAMREALLGLALHVVEVEGLGLEVDQVSYEPPAGLSRVVIEAIETACHTLELSHTHMASYAGHDTQVMAGITQAGMFFVPSVEGASHSPREMTRDEDCINAGNVLLQAALRLAGT